ncbi:homeobox protein CDX-4-like [Candoia aspera]|uniref:homeobox protein CDX-4-like n=1 Tax=Candoia aspera TaxID=51853 RepID=UPI002FD7EF27
MYVNHILEKEASMYPGLKRLGRNQPAAQNLDSSAPCPDYMSYHSQQLTSMENQSFRGWESYYGLHGEDWNAGGPGPSSTGTLTQINRSSPGKISFTSANYNTFHPAGPVALPSLDTMNSEVSSRPLSQRPGSYEWMRKNMSSSNAGKTRTKEKYRVVYTDQQRLELEKEFHCNRYVTLRRKSELAAYLGLSERQIKIWFQNRRAKERKLFKKKISQFDGSGGSAQSESSSAGPTELPASVFSATHPVSGLQPLEILQIMATD